MSTRFKSCFVVCSKFVTQTGINSTIFLKTNVLFAERGDSMGQLLRQMLRYDLVKEWHVLLITDLYTITKVSFVCRHLAEKNRSLRFKKRPNRVHSKQQRGNIFCLIYFEWQLREPKYLMTQNCESWTCHTRFEMFQKPTKLLHELKTWPACDAIMDHCNATIGESLFDEI